MISFHPAVAGLLPISTFCSVPTMRRLVVLCFVVVGEFRIFMWRTCFHSASEEGRLSISAVAGRREVRSVRISPKHVTYSFSHGDEVWMMGRRCWGHRIFYRPTAFYDLGLVLCGWWSEEDAPPLREEVSCVARWVFPVCPDEFDLSHVRRFYIYGACYLVFYCYFYCTRAVNAVELANRVEASYRYPHPVVDRRPHHCRHLDCPLLPGRILNPSFQGFG